MRHIKRSALIAHSDQQMFELVNDIEAYPKFMNGCVGSAVISRTQEELVARLDLSRMGMNYSFTTRNVLVEPTSMEMQLVDGPFERLNGLWLFEPLSSHACKVSLELTFAFKSMLVAKAAEKWFESIANELVDGVCKRAKSIYEL